MPGTEKLHVPPESNDKHPVSFYPNVHQSFPHEVKPCLRDEFTQKPKLAVQKQDN